MYNRPWLTSELAVIRKHYPVYGAALCVKILDGRTTKAVQQMALRNGIPAPHSMEIVKMKLGKK